VSDAFGIGIKPFFSGVLVVGHWRKHTLSGKGFQNDLVLYFS
jgi:hypothetical protein